MQPLATIHELVPAPQLPQDTSCLTAVHDVLLHHGYTLAACARRLGIYPRLGVNFWPALRGRWTPNLADPVDLLIQLFIDHREIPLDAVHERFGSAFVDTLCDTGVARKNGNALEARLCLFPCYGKYIVTDRAAKNTVLNQVMWLWGESFLLGGIVPRTPRRRALDLGTGSGVHAILAADHCQSVVAADINRRALLFARFNAALNGTHNIQFIESDLFSSLAGDFDLLVANPPYLHDASTAAGDNFWSGGPHGSEILGRIVQAIPGRLAAAGTAHIVALYACVPGSRIQDLFAHWLAGELERFDVLDFTWRVPNFQDLLSARPFSGDQSAWRFGVVSLRHARGKHGWWKAAGETGVFFGKDGSPAVIADHDAPTVPTALPFTCSAPGR